MNGLRGLLFIIGFSIATYFGGLSEAQAFICDPSACVGQPFDFGPLAGSCDGTPYGSGSPCGRCYCDGSNGVYCRPYEGTPACPTPTPAPTPTAAPGLSFSFTPHSFHFGDVAAGATSSGVTVVVKNESGVTGTNCNVYNADEDNFNITGGSCGTLAPAATCTVTVYANPTTAVFWNNQLCIRCDTMPICPVMF